jgi:hypothetical protein
VRRGMSLAVIILFAVLGGLPAASPARTIDLEAYRFDTSRGEPAIPADLALSPGDTAEHGYFLVQTDGPVTDAWREELTSSGAVIYGYIPEYTYLVGLDARARSAVRNSPRTSWMGPFHPAYKISPEIGLMTFVTPERMSDSGLLLMVRVFQNMDAVASAVEALGGTVRERTDDGFSRRLVVHIPVDRLHDLARIPDVWWIEEKPEFRTMNNTTKWVIQSNTNGWTPLWDHGLFGVGQIATIMDTGVDYNSCWFREIGNLPPGPTHRKVIDYTLYGGNAYDGCDTGHGSHVAGTMLGDQSYINAGNYNYNGMAYRARLTVQDVGQDDSWSCTTGSLNVPSSLTAAFTASYGLGARVHTNSWGSTSYAYDGYCVDIDNAMWNHKDYLVCFAAGNSGPGGSTVGSPGTAKDLVTVGATQQAPNQENIASYSSRGPAPDGRYKPTVTAPGGEAPTYITSVDNDPNNPPNPTCATASSPFEGTSMATPAVSGSALQIRQYYVDGYYPSGEPGGTALVPSAALIKATLIASTHDMNTADIPNNNEGWGRLLLDNSLYFTGDTRELWVQDDQTGLDTGQSWSDHVSLDSSTEPLVVTLVWTDYPGTSGSGVKLVNDLDLVVTAPGGTQYKGNVFSGGHSTTGGNADRLNVEECVRLSSPPVGEWTLQVNAYNIPHGPQPFAVVVNGAIADWPSNPEAVSAAAPPSEGFIRCYPNPMSDRTSLHYAVPAGYTGPVEVVVTDVQGRIVRTLVRKGQTPGDYRVTWEGLDQLGHDLPGGVYFARLTAGSLTVQTKVVLRK